MTAVLSWVESVGTVASDGGSPHAGGGLALPGFRRPPPLEPGYDDDPLEARWWPSTAPQLPFEDATPPPIPAGRGTLDRQPGPRSRRLPEASRWASRFLHATLEMSVGRRPVTQLREWATLPAIAGVRAAFLRPVRLDHTGRAVDGDSAPGTLHSLRVTEPADGVAEFCAVVRYDGRYRAVAARLEELDDHWRCVAFRML